MSEEILDERRGALERALDAPEGVLLWLPWPSTPRIVILGTCGFVRQILRSRRAGLHGGPRASRD